jgi:hypothetical protein
LASPPLTRRLEVQVTRPGPLPGPTGPEPCSGPQAGLARAASRGVAIQRPCLGRHSPTGPEPCSRPGPFRLTAGGSQSCDPVVGGPARWASSPGLRGAAIPRLGRAQPDRPRAVLRARPVQATSGGVAILRPCGWRAGSLGFLPGQRSCDPVKGGYSPAGPEPCPGPCPFRPLPGVGNPATRFLRGLFAWAASWGVAIPRPCRRRAQPVGPGRGPAPNPVHLGSPPRLRSRALVGGSARLTLCFVLVPA